MVNAQGEFDDMNVEDDELRQAQDALKESINAVTASERRVAELRKAWEEAVDLDAGNGDLDGEVNSVLQDLEAMALGRCPTDVPSTVLREATKDSQNSCHTDDTRLPIIDAASSLAEFIKVGMPQKKS